MPEVVADFLKHLTEKPTIRILIYVDTDIINDEFDFGITELKRQIEKYQPSSAKICVHLISRSFEWPQARLDKLLCDKTYSQVWFFGFCNMTLEENPAEENPHKFSNEEICVLLEWMKEGGVLISGDHAEKNICFKSSENNCPEELRHIEFLTLGRALGKQVPRAGQLRQWEGPPTNSPRMSFNTLTPPCNNNFESNALENDAIPQQLILIPLNQTERPIIVGQPEPHIIFKRIVNDKVCWIRVLPDHMHEGKITLPRRKELERKITLPSGEEVEIWPQTDKHVRPEPYVAAYGIDKRNGDKHAVIAVYHGVDGKAGRIVADSSWHHYLNDNLREFASGNPGPDSVIAQIGQFYVNVALWLAGRENIRKMAHHTFYRLARHPRVREEMSGDIKSVDEDILNIGRVAHHILSREATPCEIHELLQVTAHSELRQKFETLNFPTENFVVNPLPSQQLLLGATVYKYEQRLSGIINSTLSTESKLEELEKLPTEGFDQARDTHLKMLGAVFDQAQNLI